jgi:hypothetical protein
MKRLFSLGLMALLISCGSPELSTPAPTPEAIQVIFPSALNSWADKFSGCASGNPLVGLYFYQSPMEDKVFDSNNMVLELGEPLQNEPGSYMSQIGWDQIDVIVNQDNKISQLTTNELQGIFSGLTSIWDNDNSQPIQVWVLPTDDTVRKYFDRAVLLSLPLTSEAKLAPDSDAMLQAISNDTNAIGYLPESIISSSDPDVVSKVKIVHLDKSLNDDFYQPIIAITQSEPEGLLRELLVCAQTSIP